jgi:hypothetical protein
MATNNISACPVVDVEKKDDPSWRERYADPESVLGGPRTTARRHSCLPTCPLSAHFGLNPASYLGFLDMVGITFHILDILKDVQSRGGGIETLRKDTRLTKIASGELVGAFCAPFVFACKVSWNGKSQKVRQGQPALHTPFIFLFHIR